jgi:hypothetical protein
MNYTDDTPDKVEVKHYEMETVKAVGKSLYDKNGNKLQLKGINYGNWLNQEGWMSVNSLGPKLNEDGSYVKVNNEGVVEEYEVAGITYYLFENYETVRAVWLYDSYECDISGEVTIDEIKKMIDSIQKG